MMKRFVSFFLFAVFIAIPFKAFNYFPTSPSSDFDFKLDPFFTDSPSVLPLTVSLPLTSANNENTPGLNRSGAIVLGTEALLITGIMTSLYVSWYSGSETGGFHFYNDNKEWLQMDKFGHANSCYNFANIGYEALAMVGMDEKRSIIYGAPLGITIMTLVEVFDAIAHYRVV